MFCLKNSCISFQNKIYKNNQGRIPTEENFSVSLANIVLHYITNRIKSIQTCYVYKRYNDDIKYIYQTGKSNKVEEELAENFNIYNLSLNFKKELKFFQLQKKGAEFEFLDIK